MRNYILILLVFSPFLILSQSLYNPYQLYDLPGGLYDKDSLRNLHINFQDSNYHNILVNSFFSTPSSRFPATIILNGRSFDSVGVRYKGNSTFCLPNDNGNPKVPFNIDMNYWVSGQKLLGYKKLKLANAWMDPTFAKEFTAAKIYRKYLPCPEVNLIKLHVQGNYLGMYVNTESINKQFLDKHFNEKSGPLFKCDPSGMFCDTTGAPAGGVPNLKWLGIDSTEYYDDYTIKSPSGWTELLNFIYTLNYNFNEIDSVLNVDRVLWAFAVNSVISNLDTYNGYYIHNYYLYQTKDRLFQMIPWDLDNSFLGAILGFTNPTTLYERDPYYHGALGDRPLAYNLLNDPLYRKQYTAHLRTIINEALDTSVIRGSINELQTLAHSAVDADLYRQYSTSEYYNNVESHIGWFWRNGGIMETIDGRKTYLLSHPEISLTPPILYGPNISNNLVTVSAANETIVELMATTSEYNSKFQSFQMYDDGTNGDAWANDGIYTSSLPFQSSTQPIKFYFRAHNNDAIILSPERAEYEFYEYSPISNILEYPLTSHSRNLIRITDLIGRESKIQYNTPLFFIYDDGYVEKRVLVQ